MMVEELEIPGVLLIMPKVFTDDRGYFFESWRAGEYEGHGMGPFVQDNVSVSRRGVLRGMHFQNPRGQGKLVAVVRGTVFDVAADVRKGSPTFGQWVGVELSDSNNRQLYIPEGFAHGFVTLTDDVIFSYKCTDYYDPGSERTIRWNDPTLAISWPVEQPRVAAKDACAQALVELRDEYLPSYRPRD